MSLEIMKLMKYLFVFVVVAFSATSCENKEKKENTIQDMDPQFLVKNCYKNYKQGLLKGNGKLAIANINKAGMEYYDIIMDYVLEADSTTVTAMPLIDKLMILSLRWRSNPNDLIKLKESGINLFEYGVNMGFIGQEAISNSELGSITFKDNIATARVINNGREIPMQFKFVKEEGKWKFDVKYVMMQTGYGLQQFIGQSGMSEEEYMMDLLSKMSSKPLSNDVWKPIITK